MTSASFFESECRLVVDCLEMLVPEIRSGVTTEHIDRFVFDAMD